MGQYTNSTSENQEMDQTEQIEIKENSKTQESTQSKTGELTQVDRKITANETLDTVLDLEYKSLTLRRQVQRYISNELREKYKTSANVARVGGLNQQYVNSLMAGRSTASINFLRILANML